ncbi:MAG: 50S ribosomal protein L24 [Candidatus Micrarchaeota archaeon]|nr:50S ribosomal protein L24 [Candidatus Micrarchaeota archaeon]
MESGKPRKQRLFRDNAPMHMRQHFVNAHISKELKAKLGIKRRSIEIRRGDTVKIMAGGNKGKTGKVLEVDLNNYVITVDGIIKKKSKGKEIHIPISASNVYLTDLDLTDKRRSGKLEALKGGKAAATVK